MYGDCIDSELEFRHIQKDSDNDGNHWKELLPMEISLRGRGYDFCYENPKKTYLLQKADFSRKLNKLLRNEKDPNCIIVVEKRNFACHFSVLQTYSRLFDEFRPFKRLSLPWNKCKRKTFDQIYRWMENPDPLFKIVTPKNVLDLYVTSKYLQIDALEKQCIHFLNDIKLFKETTAGIMYTMAEAKKLKIVQNIMLERVNRFFLVLVYSTEWLRMGSRAVKDFLNSNEICVVSEMDVFASAVRWLIHDKKKRLPKVQELFACIRFKHMNPRQLMALKLNKSSPLVQDPGVREMLTEAYAYSTIKESDPASLTEPGNYNFDCEPPEPRNWITFNKTYTTYRQFLEYLDAYARDYYKAEKLRQIRSCYRINQGI